MHRLSENMFLLSLRKDHINNLTKKNIGPIPPVLDFKNNNISTQILQKQPYQTPMVARLRDMYAPTSRKYNSTEPKQHHFSS